MSDEDYSDEDYEYEYTDEEDGPGVGDEIQDEVMMEVSLASQDEFDHSAEKPTPTA